MIMISITMKVIVADVRHLKLHEDYTNKAAGELWDSTFPHGSMVTQHTILHRFLSPAVFQRQRAHAQRHLARDTRSVETADHKLRFKQAALRSITILPNPQQLTPMMPFFLSFLRARVLHHYHHQKFRIMHSWQHKPATEISGLLINLFLYA